VYYILVAHSTQIML